MNTDLQKIRKALKHCSTEWTPSLWLDTGVPDLNQVLGHRDRGIPYGRIIEISGRNSEGKTAISMSLAAAAQQDGAAIIWEDLETSFDSEWATMRGIAPCPKCKGTGHTVSVVPGELGVGCATCGGNPKKTIVAKLQEGRGSGMDESRLTVIQPYVGTFGEEKESRLTSAQELCAETEALMGAMHKKFDRMVVVLDSVASLLTETEASAGLENAGLPSNMALPVFMGKLLRRWVGLAQAYNAMIIMVNQLRQNPMARFSDPWYCPGGNALPFYSHVRARVYRAKGGRMRDHGKVCGIQGILQNTKNKTGGLEWSKVAYKIWFNGPVEFLPAADLVKEEENE